MSRLYYTLIVLTVLIIAASRLQHQPKQAFESKFSKQKQVDKKYTQMLFVSARLKSIVGIGSATVIYSKGTEFKIRTYFLTNYHTVNTGMYVYVETFDYDQSGKIIGTYIVKADIAAYDVENDLALLKSRNTTKKYKYVAKLYDMNDNTVKLLDRLYAVGCALGEPPTTTVGLLNSLSANDFKTIWMSSANIIFGNSGGGMFRWSKKRNRYELIGIPSSVEVARIDPSIAIPVSHIGLFVPYSVIYEFLAKNNHKFIYDDSRQK